MKPSCAMTALIEDRFTIDGPLPPYYYHRASAGALAPFAMLERSDSRAGFIAPGACSMWGIAACTQLEYPTTLTEREAAQSSGVTVSGEANRNTAALLTSVSIREPNPSQGFADEPHSAI